MKGGVSVSDWALVAIILIFVISSFLSKGLKIIEKEDTIKNKLKVENLEKENEKQSVQIEELKKMNLELVNKINSNVDEDKKD